jgi:DNA-binding transcriptional MerR regulator
MDGLTISTVAQETGFSPSALRFYEGQGLITPARTRAGYRIYDAATVETLRFIARAKRLGLSLDEIRDLVALFDERRCAPVQDRLRALLTEKITEAQEQVAALVAFTAQLQQAAGRLGAHTPDGPCDDECGCTTDTDGSEPTSTPVLLSAKPVPRDEVPIACTFGAGEMQGRITDWQEALHDVTRREPIEGGVRVYLPRTKPIARLASLIEAEQTCCQFFTFTLTIGIDTICLDATGPEGAEDIIHALVGAASRAEPHRRQLPKS